jgi:hypothetical protein
VIPFSEPKSLIDYMVLLNPLPTDQKIWEILPLHLCQKWITIEDNKLKSIRL